MPVQTISILACFDKNETKWRPKIMTSFDQAQIGQLWRKMTKNYDETSLITRLEPFFFKLWRVEPFELWRDENDNFGDYWRLRREQKGTDLQFLTSASLSLSELLMLAIGEFSCNSANFLMSAIGDFSSKALGFVKALGSSTNFMTPCRVVKG